MFSRHITVQIKKTWISEIPQVFDKEVLPLLRRQKGFLDELLLVPPDKTEVVAISLWENKEFAETYNREFYPKVVKTLRERPSNSLLRNQARSRRHYRLHSYHFFRVVVRGRIHLLRDHA